MSYFVTTNAHDHRGGGGGRRTAMILSIEQERLTPDYVFSPGETIAGAVLVRRPARGAVYGADGKSAALPNADPDPDVRLECRCEVSLTFHPQRPGGSDGAQRVTHTFFLTDIPLQATSDRSTRQLIIKLAGVDSPEESSACPWRMYRFAHRLPAGNIPSSCQVEEPSSTITGRRGSAGSVTYSMRCSAPDTSDAIQRAINVLASLDLTLHPHLAKPSTLTVTVGTAPITSDTDTAHCPRRVTAVTPMAPPMITPTTPPPVYGSWTEAESARSDAHIGRRSGRGGSGGGSVEPRRGRQEERGVKTALVRVSSLRPSGAPRPPTAPILVRADVHSDPALHLPPVTS